MQRSVRRYLSCTPPTNLPVNPFRTRPATWGLGWVGMMQNIFSSSFFLGLILHIYITARKGASLLAPLLAPLLPRAVLELIFIARRYFLPKIWVSYKTSITRSPRARWAAGFGSKARVMYVPSLSHTQSPSPPPCEGRIFTTVVSAASNAKELLTHCPFIM